MPGRFASSPSPERAGRPRRPTSRPWQSWPSRVSRLSRALGLALQTPSVRQRFLQQGYEPLALTAPEFGALIASDVEAYATLIRRAGITADP
jgi:hypothetical protein